MRLRLAELQESGKEAKKLRVAKELQRGWEDIDKVLHYQVLSFVPKSIRIKLISQCYNNFLAGDFGINKTRELLGWK